MAAKCLIIVVLVIFAFHHPSVSESFTYHAYHMVDDHRLVMKNINNQAEISLSLDISLGPAGSKGASRTVKCAA